MTTKLDGTCVSNVCNNQSPASGKFFTILWSFVFVSCGIFYVPQKSQEVFLGSWYVLKCTRSLPVHLLGRFSPQIRYHALYAHMFPVETKNSSTVESKDQWNVHFICDFAATTYVSSSAPVPVSTCFLLIMRCWGSGLRRRKINVHLCYMKEHSVASACSVTALWGKDCNTSILQLHVHEVTLSVL